MRRWLTLAFRIFPARWRSRYGEEFTALLEDVRPGWKDLADVLREAIRMQIFEGRGFLKLAAGLSIVCALIGLGLSFSVPAQYESFAIVGVTPTGQKLDDVGIAHAEQIRQNIVSRSFLTETILELNLYRDERNRLPMDVVVEQMLRRDLRVDEAADGRFRISFRYPDQVKAHKVTQKLTVEFLESNLIAERNRVTLWRQFQADMAKAGLHQLPQPDPPAGMKVAVLAAPGAAIRDSGAGRWYFAVVGLLAGSVIALAVRRPKPALRIAVCAAAGGLAAVVLSSFAPQTYTSTAYVRLSAPVISERIAGVNLPSPSEQFAAMRADMLSDESIASLLASPVLHLDPKDPARVRERIHIGTIDEGHWPLLQISVTDSSRFVAKQMADQLVSRAMIHYWAGKRAVSASNVMFREIAARNLAENLELLDPASLPERPVAPHRAALAAIGIALGIGAGLWMVARGTAVSSRGSV